MAEKRAGGLYMQIGLTLSKLQSDFLAAEQTVKSGIAQLNRQQNLIRLRMEADTAGLDRVTDATKILETQERGLTQLLDLQRDKLKLATAAYQDVANSQGANSAAAKQLETSMERERLAVARLEAQLKNLSAQKISINTSQITTQLQDTIAKLNAKINNVRITAELDASKLQAAGSVFDAQKARIAAVTKEIDLQRQKLAQLQAQMYQSAKQNGADSTTTLNIKTNVLQQIQQINQLKTKLKELQNTNINVQVRAESLRQAEAAISENIARINAKIEHIRVKTDIDVSKLGAAATEFDKAKAHVQGLNRELDLQNKKLLELKNALRNSISTNGLNNVKTINLQTEIQKQIQAINQLKSKINELNNIPPPKTNGLLNGYLNIKGNFAGKINELSSALMSLQGATTSADSAMISLLNIVGRVPVPVGVATAAIVGIPIAIKAMQNALFALAKPAITAGDFFYVMSRGMQLSLSDMKELSTIAKVTGISIDEVNNGLRRFSMQMTKADEKNSLAMQTMKRYGAELYDANGKLKNGVALSLELSKALKAAQAEGNGAAFRDIVSGKFWTGDFVTYLEDLTDNIEQAKKVVKNGLANPTWAHAIQGEINTLNAQLEELGWTVSAAFMPVAAEIVPETQRQLAELTKVIAANKENVKLFGDAMALPIRVLNEFTSEVIKFSTAIDAAKDKGTALGKTFESLGEYRDDLSALMNVAPTTALWAMTIPGQGTTKLAIAAYRDEIEEFKQAQIEAEKAAKDKNDARQAMMDKYPGLSALSEGERQKLVASMETMDAERIKREQETADIIYKMNHTSYENSLHDLERWKDEQLRIITETEAKLKEINGEDVALDDERFALFDNYNAKQKQLMADREKELAEIRQRISAAERTDLENRMIAIEDEKNKWIQAGMEKAEAEELAERQKADFIRNIEQELSAEIQAVNQNSLERKLSQIEKEKQAWIKRGAEVAKAEQLAQAKRLQAYQETEQKLNEIRNSVASTERSELEKKIADIEREKEAWIQAGMEKAEAEELAQQKIQKAVEENETARQEAAENYAQSVAKAYDDAARKTQASFDEAERKNAALRNEAFSVLKQEAKEFEVFMKEGYEGLRKLLYNKMIKSGVNPDQLKQMTPETLSAYQNATKRAMKSFLPNWEDPYSGKVYAPKMPEIPDILKEVPKTISAFSSATDAATKALYNFAGVADNSTVRQPMGEIDSSLMPSFEGLPTAVQNAVEALNNLPMAVMGVQENFGQMSTPQMEQIINPFSSMDQDLQVTIQRFSEMNLGVEEVTVRLNDLSAALNNISLRNGNSSARETRPPIIVNATVQIEEAHAWDSQHIQELAERVADKLESPIINAIGGDDNAY